MSRSTVLQCVVVALGFAFVAALPGCNPSHSSESIQNKGSDTLLEVAQAWAQDYPDRAISVEVSGGGSGVGFSALISGTVDIANASRNIKDKEIENAKKAGQVEPQGLVVGYDALAIYVHKDNPLEDITIEQLKQIFGKEEGISSWDELGVKVPGCGEDEIVLIGRQDNSGTNEYFREHVLGKTGQYSLNVIKASGSKDLVTRVASTPCAIGYSGMGYKTDGVKFVKVKQGEAAGVLPSIPAVHDSSYPISRPLFMYTLGEAKGSVKTYLDWVRSDAGQKILEGIGYVPLSPAERTKPDAGSDEKGSDEKGSDEKGSAEK